MDGWMEEEKREKNRHTNAEWERRTHRANEGIHDHQRRYSARENKDGNKQDLHAFYMHTLCIYTHTVFISFILLCSVLGVLEKKCTLTLGSFYVLTPNGQVGAQLTRDPIAKRNRDVSVENRPNEERRKIARVVYWLRHTLAPLSCTEHFFSIANDRAEQETQRKRNRTECSTSKRPLWAPRYVWLWLFCYSLHDYMWLYVNYGIPLQKIVCLICCDMHDTHTVTYTDCDRMLNKYGAHFPL